MSAMGAFKKFWHTENSSVALVRDVLVALLAVLIILMVLWAYTGQWFSAPMVAIESGSMEHQNAPFGRLGTIDAGDMVLVVKVTKASDVVPHGGNVSGAQAQNGWQSYGNYGDVIIYKPLNRTDVSQIIHRAMCWVDVSVHSDGRTYYTIKDFGIYNQTTLTLPWYGLNGRDPQWTHSGFLTKGDNNAIIDQISNICPQPIEPSWIFGKARSEIPWVGTINLFFEDLLHGSHTVANVHEDSLVCLGIVLAVLISIPIVLDVHDYLKKKKEVKEPPKV
jgi:signal peptidase I